MNNLQRLCMLGIFCVSFSPLLVSAALRPSVPTSTLIAAQNPSANNAKQIALTFDDGPYGTSTDQILTILEREHVSATFFVIGQNVLKFPTEVARMQADGDMIGNHSYDHSKHLNTFSAPQLSIELSQTDNAIASVTGFHTHLFRPPYGLLSPTMKSVLLLKGYTTIMWSVDPVDWNYPHSPAAQIVARVLADIKPGSIILLHDGRDTHVDYPRNNLVDALPTLIEDLKKQGYTFVTLDEHSATPLTPLLP